MTAPISDFINTDDAELEGIKRCIYTPAEYTKISQLMPIMRGVLNILKPSVVKYVYSPKITPVFVPIASMLNENIKTEIRK